MTGGRVLDIVPQWQDHRSGSACWCGPVYQVNLANGNLIWTHRAANDDPHKYAPENDPANNAPNRGWAVVEFAR